MSREQQTYNPCDDCQYAYSKNGQESSVCKICEFTYFRDRKQSKGEWIGNSEKFSNIYDSFYCSNCGNYTTERNPYRLGKYCSFCGAKMNGVKSVFNEGGFESKALKGGE